MIQALKTKVERWINANGKGKPFKLPKKGVECRIVRSKRNRLESYYLLTSANEEKLTEYISKLVYNDRCSLHPASPPPIRIDAFWENQGEYYAKLSKSSYAGD